MLWCKLLPWVTLWGCPRPAPAPGSVIPIDKVITITEIVELLTPTPVTVTVTVGSKYLSSSLPRLFAYEEPSSRLTRFHTFTRFGLEHVS
jgi:hypothetical protein